MQVGDILSRSAVSYCFIYLCVFNCQCNEADDFEKFLSSRGLASQADSATKSNSNVQGLPKQIDMTNQGNANSTRRMVERRDSGDDHALGLH